MLIEEKIANKFIHEVCRELTINPDTYFSDSRKQHLVDIRSCIYKILINNTKLGIVRIGKLNNRHYTTVINGLRSYNRLIGVEDCYTALYDKIEEISDAYFENT